MKSSIKYAVVLIVVFVAIAAYFIRAKTQVNGKQRELNLLCWAGYEEPQFLGAFEKKYNVKVNYKTFFGGDGMMALLKQSPGIYDVVVVDKDYLQKLLTPGSLQELEPNDYDFSQYIAPFQKYPPVWQNGKLYGVVVEFGSSALVYNTKHLTAEDVATYGVLSDPKVKGKVGIWDWYLPNMGNISLWMGNKLPFDVSDVVFTQLVEKMNGIRPQIAAFHAGPSEIISALANEQIWVIPGSGEWLASILKQQGKPVDWTIPKEGGLIWIDALVIPKDAPHPDIAKLYIQWMMTPEAQVLLSQKQAFNSNVCNKNAYALLTQKQKDILKVHNEHDAIELINKLSDRTLPTQQSEKKWQDAWEQFKASR